MADAGDIGRPMKYPYTYSAKIAQFPWKFYVTNHWFWKWYIAGFTVCLPIFWKIHKLANSPENVRLWDEKRRKELEALKHGHH